MDLAQSIDGDVKDVMSGYKLFGTVKEIGVDDTGLMKFYHDHFTYPLFKDDGLVFYNDFFGKRKIKLTTYNPMKLYKGYKDMTKRLKEKKLEGNLTGEGMVSFTLNRMTVFKDVSIHLSLHFDCRFKVELSSLIKKVMRDMHMKKRLVRLWTLMIL